MQIVSSHNSLDFDALASQLAVTILYPSARMAISSPVLGNIRDYLTMHRSQLPLVQMKHLRGEELSKIFIVDCQHIDRLDPVIQELIEQGTPYSIFDHHQLDPQALGTKAQSDSIIDCVGACTTLLVEKIRKEKIKLTPFQATLLALGIYEDTGCLTYTRTADRDAAAVSYLLESGADLPVINEYMRPKLTDAQQDLFQKLITDARIVNLSGNRLVFAAAACVEYIDGLATLTRKLLEVESANAAITAVFMRDRLYLVGRSDTEAIDVSQVMKLHGGGGHPGAASAVVKWAGLIESDFFHEGRKRKYKGEHQLEVGKDLANDILAKAEEYLGKHIRPEPTAAQIMSMPAKMILPSVSMEEAGKIMIRYNLDGLLVVENGQVLGVVSKRDVDQAHHHKLGHARVSGFMSRPVITVEPGTPFSDIQSIMVRHNIGRLPIMSKDGQLLGVVSRSDVLRILFDKSSAGESLNTKTTQVKLPGAELSGSTLSLPGEYRQIYNMNEQLAGLDSETLWLYRQMGAMAAQLNMVAYAVGGSVRDMILGQKQFDLDFVIEVLPNAAGESSAISLAEKLAATYPDKFKLINKHERFQTVAISFLAEEERLVDLSTARQEFYEYPAALPSVEPSILREDIFRRDFTINTLALTLNPDNFGTLIDYFNGLQDLQLGIIRVLHQFSFVEDPTRILRAARFAGRFGFRLDDNTAQLARQAIDMGIFDNLAGARMKEELRLILELPSRLQSLDILSKLGARLRYLDQELEYGPTERKLLRRAEQLLKRHHIEKKKVG